MTHTITIDQAGEIDAAWVNTGSPRDGLRIVGYRTTGNGAVTMLTVPGDEWAPRYQLRNGSYVHIAGVTLDQWFARSDQRDHADTIRDMLSALH